MQSRADLTRTLLGWGFSAFEKTTPIAMGSVVATAKVGFGKESTVPAVLGAPWLVTVPRGQQVQTSFEAQADLQAPVAKGAVVGKVIATSNGKTFSMHKSSGQVRDVFRTRNMRGLPGRSGIAHVRYPTAGSAGNDEEAQPFYVNAPFGLTLAHNGNLTNSAQLKEEMFRLDRRHINTESDSEVLLNVLANELQAATGGVSLDPDSIFKAITEVHRRVKGAYACVAEIAGYGVIGFRDPLGIRPLCYGVSETDHGTEYLIASESVALEGMGFWLVRDIAPGEAVFIDLDGNFHSRVCAPNASLNPCIFEYVYFARPDSVIDGVSVYDARLKMGEYLAEKVRRELRTGDIDVVMPIPDTSRPSALQLANRLNLDYREGFIKNRYVGRTFIMPGQAIRSRSVRQKLNAMSIEFRGKNVLLVDDSIVRGTTSHEIVQMARAAGANKVYFASASPPVRLFRSTTRKSPAVALPMWTRRLPPSTNA
jgi:amidophosphoribosyltransferase